MANETRLRTLARSLTWRLSGVFIAVLLTWYLTGDARMGIEVGIAYNVIRLATQYIHDRWWAQIAWGTLPTDGADGRRAPTGDFSQNMGEE